MIQSLKGMPDLVGEDAKKFNYIVNCAKEVVQNYGYSYIETPILEKSELFIRSVGGSSDIVNKEMYRFIDNGKNDVCLRPEGTAGVVRYFIQNKLDKQPNRYRYFYYGPVFRYERPQKGRLREFHQFGCESFGEESVYEDYTIIEIASKILNKLNIEYRLELNSLGCKECRPLYTKKLKEFLNDRKDKLCQDCNRRLEQNPLRVLDCKVESCQAEYKDAPKITDNLCNSCNSDFEKLKSILDNNDIKYIINKNLVRGLDYYNKTIFEFVSSNIGAQGTVVGGGRYDGLVGLMGGKDTPAIGFGMGIERLMLLLDLPDEEPKGYYLGALDEVSIPAILKLSNKLRDYSLVELEYSAKKLRNHLKSADKKGLRYCLIIGENELKNETIWLKDLVTKDEQELGLEQFLNSIKK